ncbi:hypothetical protein ND808_25770 [Streptomyces sp. DR7-3]|uniref:hypothetical protein n=1 Tax=Streptomyces malaysiensis TaxID=92644 RepID=UPI00204358B7|nr:hypothetical protein [Streptomyces sp. DR7-3]MCM3809243.1 hypothetical protein [Streptomyces sp. DR7-3]
MNAPAARLAQGPRTRPGRCAESTRGRRRRGRAPPSATSDQRLAYLDRRAKLPHRLVDAIGDESSRDLAQDAEDRAAACEPGPRLGPPGAATRIPHPGGSRTQGVGL